MSPNTFWVEFFPLLLTSKLLFFLSCGNSFYYRLFYVSFFFLKIIPISSESQYFPSSQFKICLFLIFFCFCTAHVRGGTWTRVSLNKTATCFVCLPLKGLVRPHVTGAFFRTGFSKNMSCYVHINFCCFSGKVRAHWGISSCFLDCLLVTRNLLPASPTSFTKSKRGNQWLRIWEDIKWSSRAWSW